MRAHFAKPGIALVAVLAVLANAAATAKPSTVRRADGAENPPSAPATDGLQAQFRDPPNSARPRSWWHWLNGNITTSGIAKDLEWMHRIGLGGVQTFDVNFATPTVVDKRLAYMTPEWKDAFRFATRQLDDQKMELTIAASPGWSETGGPWVPPEDGMKKLVWSEMTVSGGKPFHGILSPPPRTTGPYRDLGLLDQFNQAPKLTLPERYGDIAVFATRVGKARPLPVPEITLGDGKLLDAGALMDGLLSTGVSVPRGSADAPTSVNFTFAKPQTVRSASIYIPFVADMFATPTLVPRLEASEDGRAWRKIAEISLGMVPTTVSFAPVTATRFRVVLAPATDIPVYGADSAPGFDIGLMAKAFGPSPTVKLLDLRLSSEARINQFEAKAGFSVARDYKALDGQAIGGDDIAPAPDVIDLSKQMAPDGSLDWTPPPGDWRITRLGWSLVGKTNHPAPDEATGLEVDKLDGAAVRRYLETYLASYRAVVGPDNMGVRGINALLTDSTEVGAFNWTPRMEEHFARLRGYDMRPWLPALTGVIVGSRAQSDRFLDDFRRTVSDLHASEHYGTVAKVAHENGLKVYGESLEGWRPSLGDDLDMRRYTDYPMAALWAFRKQDGPKPFYAADMRGAASIAHVFGQNIAAAESMTSTRQPWAYGPADLKRVIDWEFANGINRIIVHTSVHQPVEDKKPGLSLRHIGQFFNRNEAWADLAKPWVDYMARSSLLLQQGRFVADVAWFYGEEAPVGIQAQSGNFPAGPKHYGYDFVSPSILRDILKVENGNLVSSGGASYRLLYLSPAATHMTLPVLRRLAEMVEQGATIVGNAPSGSPSLQDDPAEYQRLVARLWSGGSETPVGRGRVFAGDDIESALRSIGTSPDLTVTGQRSAVDIPFVHRQMKDGELYYLNNRSERAEVVEARFRVSGKVPELWRAETGEITPLSYRIEGGETVVPLRFDPEDAFFVVFRDEARDRGKVIPAQAVVSVATITSPWNVSFEAGRGAPASTTMTSLVPLNESTDPGIRYFSGVATYKTTFSAPASRRRGSPLWLDLGSVGEVAEVKVNGQLVGSAWHAPYRINIGSAVTGGKNELEIRVANLWVNRLIGDRQPGAAKIAWTAMPTYRADAPLRPSGLMGPVRLLTAPTK